MQKYNLIISASILIIALSVFYYFVVFLPKLEKDKLLLEEQAIQQENNRETQKSIAVTDCSKETPRIDVEKLAKFRESALKADYSGEQINDFVDTKLKDYENELKNVFS